ncbi:MAG: TonB-dependent receptor [Bacteroidales bacterium]|nr:TonB-dependent receptor [Bacteroidales bacterium]
MRRFISSLLLAFFAVTGFAQSLTVTGVVTDAATGESVIGAGVFVKGTSIGTVTSIDGQFSISASIGQEIVVSSLGYKDYTFTVSGPGPVEVRMASSAEFLNEVVVVGYGTAKRANLTGAVDQVSSEVFSGRPSSNATQMLVGAIPNLNITLSDGKPSRSADYNIRGTTSVGGGGNALVLIDGVEGDPALLNPDDIESVSVLKDAASASIYGSRATFGVVLITTKSASNEAGKFNFSYNENISFLTPSNLPNIVDDGYVYAKLFRDAYYNYWGYEPSGMNTSQEFSQAWLDEFLRRKQKGITDEVDVDESGRYVYYGNTNYYKIIYKPYTMARTHNLSASGTSGKIDYYVSGRIYKYDGILNFNPDEYFTTALRSKITARPFSWLKIWENISFNYEKNHIPASHNQNSNGLFLRSMQDEGHVSAPVFNPDGTFTKSGAIAIGGLVTGKNYTDKFRNNLTTTTGARAEFFDHTLRLNADFSFKANWENNLKKNTMVSYSEAPGEITWRGTPGVNDFIQEYWLRSSYISTNTYAEYAKVWNNKHDFKVLAGFNWEQYASKSFQMLRYGLISEDVESINMAMGDNFTEYSYEGRWKSAGLFARLNYSYDERYLLELNGRYDGSSKFPTNQQWGFFPSASAAWRVSKEHWWHVNPSILSNLKLRASWGQLGNGNVSEYSFVERFGFSNLSNIIDGEGKRRITSIPSQIPDNLTWETSRTIDGGIDIGFYNGKINFTGDYYVRNTLNMYTVGPSLPDTYGASAPKGNYADLVTRGFELSLSYDDAFPLGGHDLNFGIKATLADNRSFITRYNNPSKSLDDYYEGQEIGEIWGFKFVGFFDDENQINNYYGEGIPYTNKLIQINEGYISKPGDVILEDKNGNYQIDKGAQTAIDPGDMEIVGNKHPRYHYSLSLNLEWNGFYASAMFQGIGKQDWYPSGESIIWGQYHRPYGNALAWTVNNAWTPEHRDSFLPKYSGYYRIFFSGQHKVDRYVLNAAYCRLQNLQVGWNLPSKWVKKIGLGGASIYFSGENLYTWSPLYKLTTDVDVVTATHGSDVDLGNGTDNLGDGNSLTSLRTFSLGITIKI